MTETQLVNTHQAFYPQVRATSQITQARLGLSWQEAARLANCHTLAVQSWLSSRSPHGARLDGLGVVVTSTGIQAALLNLALDSCFPSDAPQAAIDNEIETVKTYFASRGVPSMWWISPFAQPADMGQRLVEHGFELREYHLPAMVAPLASSAGWPAFDAGIQVWLARDVADLKFASAIRRQAFRFAEGVALTYFEDMADDWLRGDLARLYLARAADDGPPAAIGALIMGAGAPGVYVMATLPAWEGRGLGKAILARILSDARDKGYAHAVLTAGARAYSLYRKFGFEHIFEYRLYRTTQA